MAHEEGQGQNLMSWDERSFRKVFFDMTDMVKVLYNERTTRLQGESFNQPKGDCGNGRKPPNPSPPSTPSTPSSSSPTSPPSSHRPTPPPSPRGHAKSPLMNLLSSMNCQCTMGK